LNSELFVDTFERLSIVSLCPESIAYRHLFVINLQSAKPREPRNTIAICNWQITQNPRVLITQDCFSTLQPKTVRDLYRGNTKSSTIPRKLASS
jgi:hypothetical protein